MSALENQGWRYPTRGEAEFAVEQIRKLGQSDRADLVAYSVRQHFAGQGDGPEEADCWMPVVVNDLSKLQDEHRIVLLGKGKHRVKAAVLEDWRIFIGLPGHIQMADAEHLSERDTDRRPGLHVTDAVATKDYNPDTMAPVTIRIASLMMSRLTGLRISADEDTVLDFWFDDSDTLTDVAFDCEFSPEIEVRDYQRNLLWLSRDWAFDLFGREYTESPDAVIRALDQFGEAGIRAIDSGADALEKFLCGVADHFQRKRP